MKKYFIIFSLILLAYCSKKEEEFSKKQIAGFEKNNNIKIEITKKESIDFSAEGKNLEIMALVTEDYYIFINKSMIYIFDKSEKPNLINTIDGKGGKAPGEFSRCGVDFNEEKKQLILSDWMNKRIQFLEPLTGKYRGGFLLDKALFPHKTKAIDDKYYVAGFGAMISKNQPGFIHIYKGKEFIKSFFHYFRYNTVDVNNLVVIRPVIEKVKDKLWVAM